MYDGGRRTLEMPLLQWHWAKLAIRSIDALAKHRELEKSAGQILVDICMAG